MQNLVLVTGYVTQMPHYACENLLTLMQDLHLLLLLDTS